MFVPELLGGFADRYHPFSQTRSLDARGGWVSREERWVRELGSEVRKRGVRVSQNKVVVGGTSQAVQFHMPSGYRLPNMATRVTT